MGARDDHLHTVRVEVEAGTGASQTAPAVIEDGGGRPPIWVMALAVLIVGVIGAVVLALRPDGDTAADGSDRETTPTTEEDAATADEDAGVGSTSSASGDALVPTPVLIDGRRAVQILRDDRGFVALTADVGATPRIFRSVDAEDWFETNTTVTSLGAPNEEEFDWFALNMTDSQFVLTAAPVVEDGRPAGAVFTSVDGSSWERLEGFGSSSITAAGLPVAFSSGSAFSFEFLGNVLLAEFLTDYTSVIVPDDGVCSLVGASADQSELTFDLVSCSGELIATIGQSGFVADVAAADALLCLSGFNNSFGRSPSFVRRDLEDDSERIALFDVQPISLPAGLPSGSVVLPDAGVTISSELESCAELITLPEVTEPGMVVVDATTDEVRRWPYPETVSGDLPSFFVQPLGEFTTADGESALLTIYDGRLWTLDVTTGEWMGPLSETVFDLAGFNTSVVASESGTRVYSISEGRFTVIDIAEDPAGGALSISEQTSPINLENAGTLEFSGGILYGEDDIVFLSDGAVLWTLLPPVRAR